MKNGKPAYGLFAVALTFLMMLGIMIRLTDLDDPPLDYNPTRQLRSAIIARGLYYSGQNDADPQVKSTALSHLNAMERLEPPILESMVAFTYRLMGEETLWVSRIFTTAFWTVAAGVLFVLGRQMASSEAALVGVAYFLFLPFSIRASRSFQPDPGMVMLILLTAWAFSNWAEYHSWRWVIVTGISGGLTSLVKAPGLFFVGGMTISFAVYLFSQNGELLYDGHQSEKVEKRFEYRNLTSVLRNPQVWILAALVITPLLVYYLFGIGDQTAGSLAHWTIISRWRDVVSPSFFLRWMIRVDDLLMLGAVIAGIVGSLFARGQNRALLWGLGAGYLFYGLTFPHHIITHDYYHLPLLAIISLGIIPLFQVLIEQIRSHRRVVQVVFTSVVLLSVFYNAWIGRAILLGADYRDHPEYWQQIGESIPIDAKAIGLTQDYGFRLMYYGWRKIQLWPQNAGIEEGFEGIADDADFFVITAKNQLNPGLAEYLEARYPIYRQGSGYLIYDLRDQSSLFWSTQP